MKAIKIIFFLLIVLTRSHGQGKIYFFNKTGRPVWIQNMTITGIGSFPYVLNAESKIQYIPIETGSPAILNVMIVPKNGPYGSADGIYYLFKKNDTLIVKANEKNQPVISHKSSDVRTRELAFALKLLQHTGVTPFYSLIKTNSRLYKIAWTANLQKRGKIIDSLSRPYINAAPTLCQIEKIDSQIGRLYRNHFIGNMINEKLLIGYRVNPVNQQQVDNYYKDSLVAWSAEMDCEDCENVPLYNSALNGIYRLRFNGLDELSYLDTVSKSVNGYAKDFLLSNYLVSQIETTADSGRLLSHYDELCHDSLYNRLVHDNYSLHRTPTDREASELAIMMKEDRSEIGFNQLITKLRGKVVYIDFWASWCKPCIEEIPFSHRLREKLKGKNVVMLYISLDTNFDNWQKATERYAINSGNSFVLINPEKNKLSEKINLGPIPRYIVIDKAGKIAKLDASRPSDEKTYLMLLKLAGEH